MYIKARDRIRAYKKKHPDETITQFFGAIFIGLVRLVLAFIYLRKCNQVGSLPSVNGKPMLKNRGKVILGNNVRIWSNIEKTKILTGKHGTLVLGNNCRINGVHIATQNKISIGNNVRIGPYSLIMDSNFHDVDDHFQDVKGEPIVIEDDVWITSRVTILKGIRIGKGAVIGAGAVVTKDVPAHTLVAGVPAKVIRKLIVHPELSPETVLD